jgi:hypothetical protein
MARPGTKKKFCDDCSAIRVAEYGRKYNAKKRKMSNNDST